MEATDVNARWQAEMAPFFDARARRSSASRRCSTLTDVRRDRPRRVERPRGLRALRRRRDGARGVPPLRRTAPCGCPDGLHWNLLHLFTEAVGALRGRTLDGVGVDTWGVDYALLDERQPRARPPLPLPRRAHRRRRSGVGGLRDHRHPGHADQHRLPAAGRRSRARDAARDRARARPARLLAERRAGQRAHQRLHHRAARRAHGRVGAAS